MGIPLSVTSLPKLAW
jgi:hypothetical protein